MYTLLVAPASFYIILQYSMDVKARFSFPPSSCPRQQSQTIAQTTSNHVASRTRDIILLNSNQSLQRDDGGAVDWIDTNDKVSVIQVSLWIVTNHSFQRHTHTLAAIGSYVFVLQPWTWADHVDSRFDAPGDAAAVGKDRWLVRHRVPSSSVRATTSSKFDNACLGCEQCSLSQTNRIS